MSAPDPKLLGERLFDLARMISWGTYPAGWVGPAHDTLLDAKAEIERQSAEIAMLREALTEVTDRLIEWCDREDLMPDDDAETIRKSHALLSSPSDSLAEKMMRVEGSRWRHVKRGSSYQKIGDATLQSAMPIHEGTILTFYKADDDGKLWARPLYEFNDGRFASLDTPQGTETK